MSTESKLLEYGLFYVIVSEKTLCAAEGAAVAQWKCLSCTDSGWKAIALSELHSAKLGYLGGVEGDGI